MNKKNHFIIPLILSLLLFLASCASTTTIRSTPSGAKVYIDGMAVGKTPYRYNDSKLMFSKTQVTLEKRGYQTYNGFFYRDEKANVGAIVGGLFLLVPFLWTMEYQPEHHYELIPENDKDKSYYDYKTNDKGNKYNANQYLIRYENESNTDALRDLKSLYDDGILTKKEYETEKAKILNR